jgi:adenosylmethionine-8-amino-7-oxononanoate aminotransferase
LELAEVLEDITPRDITRFFFVCDGSEAVEAAIKMAKQHHYYAGEKQRYKVISRRGAYHGVTGRALSALGSVLPMRQVMEPISQGTVFVESPYCYRCPLHLSYPRCDLACARDVERTIEFEGPELVSAFIGEPIQQGFGALAPPDGYWQIIREICDHYGVILIVDEVICGFGRTGKWFASEHFQLDPDIICMAKGLSSGYVPLGAAGCTDEVVEPVETFQHIHTYGNHPVSCTAALKNIEIIKEEALIRNARTMGEYLLEGLRSLESHSIVGEVRGKGLWVAIECTTDKNNSAPFPMERLSSVVNRARGRGLIVKTCGPTLEFAPPLVVRREDINQAIKILEECLAEEAKDMGL